jgi:hypothetical protein
MDEAQVIESSEIVLHPDKRRAALYLSASLAFVIIGITQVAGHKASVVGWSCVLFFGICAAVFLAQFFPGASYLRLRSEGFMFCSLFRKSPLILWRDVSDFRVVRLPPSGKPLVVFDWHAAPNRGVRQLNRRLVDATDGLPDSYGLRPDQLAELMNAWRSHATLNG